MNELYRLYQHITPAGDYEPGFAIVAQADRDTERWPDVLDEMGRFEAIDECGEPCQPFDGAVELARYHAMGQGLASYTIFVVE